MTYETIIDCNMGSTVENMNDAIEGISIPEQPNTNYVGGSFEPLTFQEIDKNGNGGKIRKY